jgi:hypothetical protein
MLGRKLWNVNRTHCPKPKTSPLIFLFVYPCYEVYSRPFCMDALIWLLIWLALSIAVGTVAEKKGKSAATWMVISVLISPLIAYVILAVSESDDIVL